MAFVTHETALRHSAVWACLRLRAGLVSTFPVDVFRRVGGVQVEVAKPPVLVNPEGKSLTNGSTGMIEFLWSSQFDLDRVGNSVGLITQRDGYGLPARIELKQATSTQVLVRGGKIWRYRIEGDLYDPANVWHEKANTIGGLQVGLSPVAYAAWAIGEYLTVQEFATDWFMGGAVPRSRLKNTAKTLDEVQSAVVKEAWRASVTAGEPFVHGSDWEYDFIQAQEASADWLEAKKYSITDVARFFGVPSDMIDSAPTGATRQMTYANITQRNLQLLIMNLGPALIWREAALSNILVQPRYMKFNTDALLRLDPGARAAMFKTLIDARMRAPSEARELDNLPPFTDDQLAEFDRLFGLAANGNIYAPPDPYAPGAHPAPALPPAAGGPDLQPAPDVPPAVEPGGE